MQKKFLISFFITGLIFIFVVSSNTLFLRNNTSDVFEKVKNRLIGRPETSLYYASEIPKYLRGAFSGLVFGYDAPSIDLAISHRNILPLLSSIEGELDRKEVSGTLKISGTNRFQEDLRVKLRLKGDRNLHYDDFSTASFRFNAKGDGKLFGLDRFSLQRPIIRGYAWEPLIAETFSRQGLLTLSHEYVYFSVNGENRGLYHLEEVPTARTVEKQSRKNGPIFGLEEALGTTITSTLDVAQSSKWEGNPLYEYAKEALYSEFNAAVSGNSFSETLFDMDEWAKYFALSDLYGSYHGTVPKSVKFYFNPVIGKFQPLLFDAHVGAGKFYDFILLDLIHRGETAGCEWICTDKNFYLAFLKNPVFQSAYIEHLSVYSSPEYVSEVLELSDNFTVLNNYFYSRLLASDLIFHRGLGFYFFRNKRISDRANLINKRLTIHTEKFSNIKSAKPDLANMLELDIHNQVQVLEITDLTMSGNIWDFPKPTIVVLKGNTSLSGIDSSSPLNIIGEVMLVQEGGSIELNNVSITGGKVFDIGNRNWSGALNIISADVKIDKLKISGVDAEDAINLINSSFDISYLEISKVRSDALDLDFSDGFINKLICYDVGNDCFDVSESHVQVSLLKAENIGDKAVSGGENSHLDISQILIKNTEIGLVSKDGSKIIVDEVKLENVRLAIAAFIKKPEYNSPNMSIKSIEADEPAIGLIDLNSTSSLPQSIDIKFIDSQKIESLMYGNVYGEKTKK